MAGKPYQEWEKKFIEENYDKMSDTELAEFLPDRNGKSINAYRFRIGGLSKPTNIEWSQKEINFIEKNYYNLSDDEIGDILNKAKTTVTRKRLELGFHKEPDHSNHPRKYQYDESLFSKDRLQSPDEASLLGYIYADGSLIDNYTLQFKLHSKDGQYLKQIKSFMRSSHPIVKKENYKSPFWIMRIYHKDLCERLNCFGVYPNKSLTLEYPNSYIFNGYEKDFVRGYFEGDGSVSYRVYDNGDEKPRASFSVYGTESMVSGVLSFLQENMKRKLNVKIHKTSIYNFNFGGRLQISEIGKILYCGIEGNQIYMVRKLNIFQKIWEDLGLI